MGIADIDVAVLAGGLGTRLRGVLPEAPKILAPVGGKPFLEHLLGWLTRQGACRVLLCLGYRAADVLTFLEQRSFSPLEIETVIEPEPLGTGGAVAYALPRFRTEPVMVMNGDTIVEADLNAFLAAHHASQAEASILCVRAENTGCYGRLEIGADRRVIRFAEKDPPAAGTGWINGGVYLFGRPILQRIAKLAKGSLERDILENTPAGRIYAFHAEGRFLDIGTPEALAVAPEVLTPL